MRIPRHSRLSGTGYGARGSGRILHARGRQVICPNRAGPIIHHHHGRLVKPVGGVVHSRWDNLLMGWKANEVSDGSGAVERADVLGVNPLTDNNTTPSITDATFGEVANFQRANSEYFDIADPFYSASFVMCFWFRSNDLLNSYNLVGKDHSGAAGREYLIDQASTSGLLTFYVFSDNTTFRTAIIATSAAETWYFCVAWLDDSDKKARFQLNNGTPAVSTALPASLQDSGTALNFGRRSYPGFENYCNHRVHGLYVFSGTKDAAWRTAMYNAGAGRVYPD